MSVQSFDSLLSATRRTRRTEWLGLALLAGLSLVISVLSFAATGQI
jgi:hypothetical protein